MKKIYFFLMVLAISATHAQDGALDTSFNSQDNVSFDHTLAVGSSGVYIGALPAGGTLVQKMNHSGTVMPFLTGSFNQTDWGANALVRCIYIQEDGNILIAGIFDYMGRECLIRVTPNGVIDPGFIPNFPPYIRLETIAIQTDPTTNAKSIIVGGLSTTNSTPAIYRLNYNTGSIDNAFNQGNTGFAVPTGGAVHVNSIAMLPNGDMIVGGRFNTYNGMTRNNILKLNANGTLNSFNYTGINGTVNKILLETNSNTANILVGGDFTYSGFPPGRDMLKLNSAGVLNTSFNPNILYSVNNTDEIRDMVIQSTGKIVIVGKFDSVGGLARNGVARLHSNGIIDECFMSYADSNSTIEYIELNYNNDDLYIRSHLYQGVSSAGTVKLSGYTTADAVPDSATVSNTTATTALNVLTNDLVDGVAPNASSVIISQTSTPITGITLITSGASKGNINVVAGTAPGVYIITYKLCAYSPDCYCDTATATITVTAPPVDIVANDDTFTVTSGVTTTPSTTIRANDTRNGVTATSGNTTFTTQGTMPQGITLNSNGTITVAANVPAGTYTFTYQLCDSVQTTNCDTATVTIIVNAPAVIANNDSGTAYTGFTTTIAANVRADDTIGGVAATASNVTLTLVGTAPTGIQLNTNTGAVTVDSTVAAGTYTLTYQICDIINPTNCDTATVTINVTQSVITANQDNFLTICLNGETGGSGGDVTANDTLNGNPVNDSTITLTLISNGGLAGLQLSSTGIISVPSNSPYGTYVVNYSICQNNTSNCSTASVNICVNNGLNPGTGANNAVADIALQPDGKIIIVGAFTLYNNIQRNRVARLNPDLSLDESFDPQGIGFNNVVNSVALQGNNIIVSGRFTGTTNGIQKHLIARLDHFGNVDSSFTNNIFQIDPANSTTSIPEIFCTEIQQDGMIMIGGRFDQINNSLGTTKCALARLYSNGSVDYSFNSIAGKGTVKEILILQDGIIVGGTVSLGTTKAILYKVTSTGAFYPGFTIGQSADPSGITLQFVSSISRTYNNKIIVAGNFTSYNQTGLKNLVQISSTGIPDGFNIFNPGQSSNNEIKSIIVEPSTNKIIIGGGFTGFNNNPVKGIARLFPNGGYDSTFNTGNGFYLDGITFTNPIINDLKQQSDGKIVVGGAFTEYNGNQANYITRLVLGNPVVQGRFTANVFIDDAIVTDIEDINPVFGSTDITIYPNPSTGIFNLSFKGNANEKFEIVIYNTLGQLIHQGTVSPETAKQIDLSRFEAGNYYIRLQNEQRTINKVVTKK